MARYYDSSMGRFCSADPVGGQPGDPQSWNRYPYARNDPVNLTDPSGKFWGFLIQLFVKLIEWIVQALAHIGAGITGNVTTSIWGVGETVTVGGVQISSTSTYFGVINTVVGGTTLGGASYSGVALNGKPGNVPVGGPPVPPLPHAIQKQWSKTFPCDKSANEMGTALDKNFTDWASGDVTGGYFGFSPEGPVTEGATINPMVTVPGLGPAPYTYTDVTEVTAHNVTSSGFTFVTNPAKHVFDGTVDFRITPAATAGNVTMTISVVANWAHPIKEYLVRKLILKQEDDAWKHLEERVAQECQPKG